MAQKLLRKNGITNDDEVFAVVEASGYLERRFEDDQDYIWQRPTVPVPVEHLVVVWHEVLALLPSSLPAGELPRMPVLLRSL